MEKRIKIKIMCFSVYGIFLGLWSLYHIKEVGFQIKYFAMSLFFLIGSILEIITICKMETYEIDKKNNILNIVLYVLMTSIFFISIVAEFYFRYLLKSLRYFFVSAFYINNMLILFNRLSYNTKLEQGSLKKLLIDTVIIYFRYVLYYGFMKILLTIKYKQSISFVIIAIVVIAIGWLLYKRIFTIINKCNLSKETLSLLLRFLLAIALIAPVKNYQLYYDFNGVYSDLTVLVFLLVTLPSVIMITFKYHKEKKLAE